MYVARLRRGSAAAIVAASLVVVAAFSHLASARASGRPTPDRQKPVGTAEQGERIDGLQTYMVELTEPAAARAWAAALSSASGRSLSATTARADAARESRVQKARNEADQAETLRALSVAAPAARVLFRVQSALNGIAVVADAADLDRLRALPNVRSVTRIVPAERGNANTVPLISSPAAWTNLGLTGTGLKIGVIDTGVDYVHTNFGGTGSGADLTTARNAANNPPAPGVRIDPAFTVPGGSGQLYPSAKVVGGWDFAGDAYDASTNPVPAPDPNPMDCPTSLGGGHGSHVAGSAAGFGVNSDGSTFGGPWNDAAPFSTMRIGPGVAPQAKLYALRVFGCQGTTSLTAAAIDWALDPNGDGDFSDRLDVINMSLGSPYGTPDDASAAAATNAAAAGLIVVASAGNSGDITYVTGSPGSGTRVISVAASVDDTDVTDAFRVEPGPAIAGMHAASRSVNYDWTTFAPRTAPLYYPATNQTGCAGWTGSDLTNISGKIVLVDWRTGVSTTSPCGSTQRANNAFAAGAAGILMADNLPYFDVSISGNTTVPAFFTTKTVGDALKTVLTAGTVSTVQATLSTAFFGTFRFVTPGQSDIPSSFSSRGPQGVRNGLKPDLTAPGQGIFSTDAGTGSAGKSLNGTSMAAPHVAGLMALLKQANPGWTTEELKALAMNHARHDLYTGLNQTGTKFAPARVGAGRVNAIDAASGKVVAFSADEPGAVSVSFGAHEVLGTVSLVRNVTVRNKGAVPASYNLSHEARTSIDGVTFSFPDGPTVGVPAGGSVTFRFRLDADASLMRRTRDATTSADQAGLPRHFLSEASGLVKLTPTSGSAFTLNVPYFVTARPASQMSASPAALLFASDTGSSTALSLSGTGVDTGGSTSSDYLSIVTPFELALESPLATLGASVPEGARHADLRYVGATATRLDAGNPSRVGNSVIYFGIVTHGSRSTPATEATFTVSIDRDRNGSAEFTLVNTRLTDTDVFVSGLRQLPNGGTLANSYLNMVDARTSTAIFNTNVLVIPVLASSLGLGATTRFNYRVQTQSRFWGTIDDSGWLTFDYVSPGLDFKAAGAGDPLVPDLPGGSIPVAFNGPEYRANASRGALLLHHFNAGATKAQVVPLGCPTITVTNPAVASGPVGVAFSQTFTQTGGLGTTTFSTTSTLPAGLTLSSAGALAGTPTQGGVFPITVTATDANACTGSSLYTLTIACPTIALSPTTLPGGTPGTPFSQTVTASGGSGSYSYAVTAGTQPPGLSLSGTGTLSGTPTTGGTYSFTVTATDGSLCAGSRVYSVTIASPATVASVNPASGPTAGGQSVEITGTGLLGATGVTFGGAPGTITSNTDTRITVTTPPHAPGPVDVVVSFPSGPVALAAAYSYAAAAADAAAVPTASTLALVLFALAVAGAGLLRMR